MYVEVVVVVRVRVVLVYACWGILLFVHEVYMSDESHIEYFTLYTMLVRCHYNVGAPSVLSLQRNACCRAQYANLTECRDCGRARAMHQIFKFRWDDKECACMSVYETMQSVYQWF